MPDTTTPSQRSTFDSRYHRGVTTHSKVSLPVVRDRTHMSRIAKKRLWVLLIVQALLIAHVMLWWLSTKYGWFGGFTLTPIEPSESIQTVSDGIINAGAIFFAVALLSTAVLGRWFCGWGCHVLLLQDGCWWMLRKMGIRPRVFRSRLLMLGPLVLALYMFVWPVFYRLVLAPPNVQWHGFSTHLITRDFWATFPGLTVAIVFLLICGFATIYALGSKGFCTYGCPYGGFFAPLDRIAPLRIRVSDACQGCGECTAVCSSNVRVHEEVATHGMVIDSGCMKTMDCIEACPNDALSMGFGVVAAGKPRPNRKWDLTWPQEVVLAVLMLALVLAWRGTYGAVSMLMAMGIAIVLTWMFWKAWRVLRDDSASFLKARLRYKGKLQRAGVVFLLVTLLGGILSMQEGAVRIIVATASARSVGLEVEVPVALRQGPAVGERWEATGRALDAWALARPLWEGGVGLVDVPRVRIAQARLLTVRGDYADALRAMDEVLVTARPDQGVWRERLALASVQQLPEELQVWAEAAIAEHPEWAQFRGDVIAWLASEGRGSDALSIARPHVDIQDARKLMLQAVELLQEGRAVEALPLMTDYVNQVPADVLARASLARLLLVLGEPQRAQMQMQRAINERETLPPAQQETLREELRIYNEMLGQ